MTARKADNEVMSQFIERWSPRAFDARSITQQQLLSLFEAARWAPSAFNMQPWKFAYALRDDAHWESFLGTLIPFNQMWASNCSALIYIVSDTMMDMGKGPQPSHSHSFDAGAAWMSLALQAKNMGLITHGMTGVDFDAAQKLLGLSDAYRIEAAVAVGYAGDKASLPEGLQEKERPNERRPVAQSISNGPFNL